MRAALHPDDVIPGVDHQHLAGDTAAGRAEQEHRGIGHLRGLRGAAQRRAFADDAEDGREAADAGGGERLDRPAEIAFTRMFSGPRSAARYRTDASSAALATPITL
jgi:hypothetical protein